MRGRDYTWKFGYGALQLNLAIPTPKCPEPKGAKQVTARMKTSSLIRGIFGVVFTQMSASAGIRKHGRVAKEAMMKEFAQFGELEVFKPLMASDLTDEQKVKAPRAISVIKEKQDNTVKVRTVADGSTQRGKYDKSETYSPTVGNDALMLTILANAKEGRDVATAKIAGAYLQKFMKDFIVM